MSGSRNNHSRLGGRSQGPKAVKMNTLRWRSRVDEYALHDRAFWVHAEAHQERFGFVVRLAADRADLRAEVLA